MSNNLKLSINEVGDTKVNHWNAVQLESVTDVGDNAVIRLRCQYDLVITKHDLFVYTPGNKALPLLTLKLPTILDDDAIKALHDAQNE